METPLLVNPLHSTRGLCKFTICKDEECAMNMHKYMPDISLMTGKSERGNKIKSKRFDVALDLVLQVGKRSEFLLGAEEMKERNCQRLVIQVTLEIQQMHL